MAKHFWDDETTWSECLFIDIVNLYGPHYECNGNGDLAECFFDVLTKYLSENHDFHHLDGGNKYFHWDFEERFFDLKIRNLSGLLEKAMALYFDGRTTDEIDIHSVTKFLMAIGNMPSVKTHNIMNLG